MLRELAELGEMLELNGKVPSIGFAAYKSAPIRWVIRFQKEGVYIEETELHWSRPKDPGRTSGTPACALVDEGAYALGASKTEDGVDGRADEKHDKFLKLIEKIAASKQVDDPDLREALERLPSVIRAARSHERFGDILAKDWVSFAPEYGSLAGQHLYQHPEIRRFWAAELEERNLPKDRAAVVAECAICGQERPMVKKLPRVAFTKNGSLSNLNAEAYVSFLTGTQVAMKASVGCCFECGERTAQVFNYLARHDYHHKALFRDGDNPNSLANQHAVYWLRDDVTISAGETVLDPDALLGGVTEPIAEARASEDHPVAHPTLPQLAQLIDLPWKPKEEGLNLDEMHFYLAILSPNVGRIALRDWYDTSLAELRKNLSRFLAATAMVAPWGDAVRPISISSMIRATGTANPNLTRQLLRTAYLGHSPPLGLITAAVRRLRVPATLQDPEHRWESHALIAGIKLCLFYGKEEVHDMDRMNKGPVSKPYLCGQLLSIFEEAQQRASHWSLNTTLVDRYFGSMSTAPGVVLGTLFRQATTAHLPKLRKEHLGHKAIAELLESVSARLGAPDGLPATFDLREQGEFALGYYQQRAWFRSKRGKAKASDKSQKGDEE